MIIHFEGLDLAGKSTVCRRVAAQAPGDWELRRNCLTADNPVHALADTYRLANQLSAATVGEVYLAALAVDIETWSRPLGNVIQDSTIALRSVVYHRVAGSVALAERFEALLAIHPRFDKTFVCVCDREVRLERLARRRSENLGPEDFIVRDDPVLFAEMESCLVEAARQHFDAELLDTSDLEASEDVTWILNRFPEETR